MSAAPANFTSGARSGIHVVVKRVAARVVVLNALLSVALPGTAEEPPYTCEPNVVLGRAMAPVLERIAADFHRRTGRRLHVTSGTRTPEEQAEAMFDKLARGERLTSLYRDVDAASEIQAAYRRHRRDGRAVAVREMARVIRAQVGRGCLISRHLDANAVDVRSRNLSRREQAVLREVVRSAGNVELLQEGVPPHFHLQLR